MVHGYRLIKSSPSLEVCLVLLSSFPLRGSALVVQPLKNLLLDDAGSHLGTALQLDRSDNGVNRTREDDFDTGSREVFRLDGYR